MSLVSAFFATFSAFLQALAMEAVADLRVVAVVVYLGAAGVFFILYWLAQRNLLFYSTVGLVLYSVLFLPSVIIIGNSFWLVELMVLIALIDAVRAAFQHRRILRKALLPQDCVESHQAEN